MPESTTFHDLPILGEIGLALDAAMARELADEASRTQTTAVDDASTASPVSPRSALRRFGGLSGRPLPAIAVALILAGVGTSTAAATLTVLRGTPIPIPRKADVQPAMTPRTGSEQVLPMRAARPGGGAPFALRTGISETGLTCVTVGQAKAGRFGVTGADGAFRDMPPQVIDGCGKLAAGRPAVLGARVFDADTYDDVRTVIYGIADADLRRAELQIRGVWSAIPVDHGGFVTAIRGYPEDSATRLRLTYADGTRSLHPLGNAPNIFLDPSGPSWHYAVDKTYRSPNVCLTLTRTRSLSRGTSPRPSAMCTPLKNTRSGTIKAPFALAIRTFRPGEHGATPGHGRAFEDSWNWGRMATRTFVYGMADPGRVRQIRVDAPGHKETFPVRPGAFALAVAGSVPPGAVSVEFVMKHGPPQTFTASVNTVDPNTAAKESTP